MLYHLSTNTSIYRAGLSEVGDFFSILDNGDQALLLKQPLHLIYNKVKSTMQAIIYKTCDLFQKTKPHPASETYGSDSAFKPIRCICIIRRIIHAILVKFGPVITKISSSEGTSN